MTIHIVEKRERPHTSGGGRITTTTAVVHLNVQTYIKSTIIYNNQKVHMQREQYLQVHRLQSYPQSMHLRHWRETCHLTHLNDTHHRHRPPLDRRVRWYHLSRLFLRSLIGRIKGRSVASHVSVHVVCHHHHRTVVHTYRMICHSCRQCIRILLLHRQEAVTRIARLQALETQTAVAVAVMVEAVEKKKNYRTAFRRHITSWHDRQSVVDVHHRHRRRHQYTIIIIRHSSRISIRMLLHVHPFTCSTQLAWRVILQAPLGTSIIQLTVVSWNGLHQ